MNILFISPYIPDLIRVRPYQFLRGLKSRGHSITLVSLWAKQKEVEFIQHLRPLVSQIYLFHLPTWKSLINCVKALPTSQPLQYAYTSQPQVTTWLKHHLTRSSHYDLIHVEHLRGAQFGLQAKDLLLKFSPVTPVVWDSVDSISYLFEQTQHLSGSLFGKLASFIDLPRTRRYESYLPSMFDRVLVTSKPDREAFLRLNHSHSGKNGRFISQTAPVEEKFQILTNGVDLSYFSYYHDARPTDTIVFSGKMSYHANITAARFLVDQVMPIVWSRNSNIKVVIAGKDPPHSIKKYEQRYFPNIRVTGSVADIRPYIQNATLAALPLIYGAGVQNKVLEAMSCGTPVVCTSKAISALAIQPGKDALIADDPAEFANHILILLENQELRERIARSARKYVEKNHDWAEITARLEAIYSDACTSNSPAFIYNSINLKAHIVN